MKRYVMRETTSHKAEKKLHLMDKYGPFYSVKAIRVRVYYKNKETGQKYNTTVERLVFHGHNGKFSMAGVCWSYNGSGPHVTFAALKRAGCPNDIAAQHAFHSKRLDKTGTDWEIDLTQFPPAPKFVHNATKDQSHVVVHQVNAPGSVIIRTKEGAELTIWVNRGVDGKLSLVPQSNTKDLVYVDFKDGNLSLGTIPG